LARTLRAGSDRFGFRVVEYSVQTNHFHLLVEVPDQRALTRGAKGLFVRLARALNRLWHREGQVFPERYHVRALTSPAEVRRALVYVLHNARKHRSWGAGVDPFSSGPWFDGYRRAQAEPCRGSGSGSPPRSCAEPPARAGSSEQGAGGTALVSILRSSVTRTTTSDGQTRWISGLPSLDRLRAWPRTTQRARTWLLKLGWRCLGLLDPEERSPSWRDPRGAALQTRGSVQLR
jgi:hypothetical protein